MSRRYRHINEPIDPKAMKQAISEMPEEAQEGINDMLKLIDNSVKKGGVKMFGELSAIELMCVLVRIGALGEVVRRNRKQ